MATCAQGTQREIFIIVAHGWEKFGDTTAVFDQQNAYLAAGGGDGDPSTYGATQLQADGTETAGYWEIDCTSGFRSASCYNDDGDENDDDSASDVAVERRA